MKRNKALQKEMHALQRTKVEGAVRFLAVSAVDKLVALHPQTFFLQLSPQPSALHQPLRPTTHRYPSKFRLASLSMAEEPQLATYLATTKNTVVGKAGALQLYCAINSPLT